MLEFKIMKKLILSTLSLYQAILSPLLHRMLGVQSACRYPVSCSEYAKKSIEEYGILQGGLKSVKRLLSCQPFK